MASPSNTTQVVALNVKKRREAKGWNFAELSRALAAVGHPLAITVLQRIEAGARRIDVDDLTALSYVLEVTPTQLISPDFWAVDDEAGYLAIENQFLTGVPALTQHEACAWVTGELTSLSIEDRWQWNAAKLDTMEQGLRELEDNLDEVSTKTLEGYQLLGAAAELGQTAAYLNSHVEVLAERRSSTQTS